MSQSDTSCSQDHPINNDIDPTEFLRLQPKKSILKAKQPVSFENKEGRAHFDEMNIIATHHPVDKDYGHMKIEEPKTPYHYSDGEHSDGESMTGVARVRRVSLVGAVDPSALVAGLEGGNIERRQSLNMDKSDSDDDMSDEKREKKAEFEKKRRAHYNEGAILKQHINIDDLEDDDGDTSSTTKTNHHNMQH